MKVGEVACRTGVSVRTLHHYEEIGLLSPSHRTDAGHRLYGADDIARLQRIRSMRHLGFGLEEIAQMLADRDLSPLRILEDHLQRVREQIAVQERVRDRLEGLVATLRAGEDPDMQALLQTIEVMTMWEDKLTPDQKDEVREQARKLGAERVRELEREWVSLLAGLRAEMDKGTDPASAEVQGMLARTRELTQDFSGGNARIEQTLADAYRAGAGASVGLDAALFAYLNRAGRAGTRGGSPNG